MCRRVTCSRCGKPTFAGCGAHVEQVLGDVPRSERCRCDQAASRPAESAAGVASTTSWWKGFGR